MGLADALHTALMFKTDAVNDEYAEFVLNSEKDKNKMSDEKSNNRVRSNVPRRVAITRRGDHCLTENVNDENDQLGETHPERPRRGHPDPS